MKKNIFPFSVTDVLAIIVNTLLLVGFIGSSYLAIHIYLLKLPTLSDLDVTTGTLHSVSADCVGRKSDTIKFSVSPYGGKSDYQYSISCRSGLLNDFSSSIGKKIEVGTKQERNMLFFSINNIWSIKVDTKELVSIENVFSRKRSVGLILIHCFIAISCAAAFFLLRKN